MQDEVEDAAERKELIKLCVFIRASGSAWS